MSRIRLLLPFWMNDANLDAVARQQGWTFAEHRPATDVSEEIVWTTADSATVVSYVADFGVQLQYIVVQGAAAESIATTLSDRFPVITVDDVLDMAGSAGSRDEMVHLLYHAAVAAREDAEDPRLRAIIEQGLAHTDSEVRRAAVFATAYAPWRSFEDPLRHMVDHDDAASVREIALATLESLEQHAWGSQES